MLAALGGLAISVVMNWPLPLHLFDTIPKDLGDPLPQAWQVAWGGHALATQPIDFFQSNQFWPEPDSLAFGDALIGYAPAGLIGDGPDDAVARYNLLFLFVYALCFFGTYLLAREMGLGPGGAVVAGAAFAYAPFRMEQDGHMQVISSGGIPLALALAVRGLRLRRPWPLLGAWAVAAWQVSLGFAIGLPFAYLIALLVAIGAVVWWRRGRPRPERRMAISGVAGALLFAVAVGVISQPYFRVADRYPEATRTASDVEEFSGPIEALILNSDENWVWGDATLDIFYEINNPAEKTLFPGLVILLLAGVGLGSSSFPRWLRFSLAGAWLAIMVLAFGFQEEDGWLWPYRIVYDVLPGWEAIRTPGRLATFATLALALLAAAGAESILRAVAKRRLPAYATGAVASVLVLAIVVEGRGLPFDPTGRRAQPEVPDPPPSLAEVPGPQLHLPAERGEDNRRYTLWSTDGFPDIVNGRASTRPDSIEDLIADMSTFPDADTVERLRDYGVKTVVLHTGRVIHTDQALAPRASIKGLGLTKTRLGGLLIYELDSPSTAGG